MFCSTNKKINLLSYFRPVDKRYGSSLTTFTKNSRGVAIRNNFCLFDLILYFPVNNFSVMSRQDFLG